jgi:hypothetical protein
MVDKQHHARHKLILYEYIFTYVKKITSKFYFIINDRSDKMFIRNRTLFASYSVRIRYRKTPILYSYPHTIRSDSKSEKNMVTNTVSLLSVRIRSVFTPNCYVPAILSTTRICTLSRTLLLSLLSPHSLAMIAMAGRDGDRE